MDGCPTLFLVVVLPGLAVVRHQALRLVLLTCRHTNRRAGVKTGRLVSGDNREEYQVPGHDITPAAGVFLVDPVTTD